MAEPKATLPHGILFLDGTLDKDDLRDARSANRRAAEPPRLAAREIFSGCPYEDVRDSADPLAVVLGQKEGVMINSAALWPLLVPQWKDPKKWWKELVAAKGKKDFDWSRIAMRCQPADACAR